MTTTAIENITTAVFVPNTATPCPTPPTPNAFLGNELHLQTHLWVLGYLGTVFMQDPLSSFGLVWLLNYVSLAESIESFSGFAYAGTIMGVFSGFCFVCWSNYWQRRPLISPSKLFYLPTSMSKYGKLRASAFWALGFLLSAALLFNGLFMLNAFLDDDDNQELFYTGIVFIAVGGLGLLATVILVLTPLGEASNTEDNPRLDIKYGLYMVSWITLPALVHHYSLTGVNSTAAAVFHFVMAFFLAVFFYWYAGYTTWLADFKREDKALARSVRAFGLLYRRPVGGNYAGAEEYTDRTVQEFNEKDTLGPFQERFDNNRSLFWFSICVGVQFLLTTSLANIVSAATKENENTAITLAVCSGVFSMMWLVFWALSWDVRRYDGQQLGLSSFLQLDNTVGAPLLEEERKKKRKKRKTKSYFK